MWNIVKLTSTNTVTGTGVGEGDTQGCSGAGHGGGGGMGESQDIVGRPHGYYTQPSDYGQNGGHSVYPHVGGKGTSHRSAANVRRARRNTFVRTLFSNGRGVNVSCVV